MHPDDLIYPAIYFRGEAFFLEKTEVRAPSYFGGPDGSEVYGVEHGPRRLHHIATINGDCFDPLRHVIGCCELRLLYGMCFSGCELKYRLGAVKTEILEMSPTISDPDWPYFDFPTYLPYFPLRLRERSGCSLEEFSELSCQEIEAEEEEAIVIVPPSGGYGISLWGPSGGAQIVFRCDLERRIIRATNQ